ncbi:SIMPL domain-containing protein [Ornithobacterium rhinotracheale]|uniref:SIMPL domain-containing protein n=1 Tax=Ornithobacterium rhinotracheale TaxID=28251 RepID=UPI002158A9AE|nr:SIMPL domain-containing protein [Ornithobacterium rhinotracheale]UVD86972.1 SIMPL domain-containing protein [Ornithobacterium rhinotracheale]
MKSKLVISVIIAALGLIIATWVFGVSLKNRNEKQNTISVTGLGTKQFTSDLITWSGKFSTTGINLKEVYDALANDKSVICNYLISKGVKPEEIVFSAVDIEKEYDYETNSDGSSRRVFTGYELTQSVSIESQEVSKIENLSRDITEIINQGIEFTSSSPKYFYTKLAEVKQDMIANATKDAKERAEKIANNAGSKLGKLKKASMGVIQITAPNSDEDFSYGGTFNTASKEKEASITIRLEYNVD